MHKDLLKYTAWSISKAQCALTCPTQFKLKYVDKVKELVPPSANKVGTATHSVLELRVQGKSAKEAKEVALEKTPLTSNELERFTSAMSPIESFLVRFDTFCKAQKVKKILVEEKWAIDIDMKPVQFFSKDTFFRGVVDLAVITEDESLIIIDHKSGKKQGIEKHRPQLNSYYILGLANYPNISGTQGSINYLQGEERLLWDNYTVKTDILKKINPWLFTYLTSACESVKDLEETRPKNGWPCSWCSYNITCQPYQLIKK